MRKMVTGRVVVADKIPLVVRGDIQVEILVVLHMNPIHIEGVEIVRFQKIDDLLIHARLVSKQLPRRLPKN